MPNGVLHLAGDLLAGGAIAANATGGGGAGGAIDLTVLRIDGAGRSTPRAAPATRPARPAAAAAAGWRSATASWAASTRLCRSRSEGGASAASGGQRRGGAGTLWLEPAGGLGRLVVKNPQDNLAGGDHPAAGPRPGQPGRDRRRPKPGDPADRQGPRRPRRPSPLPRGQRRQPARQLADRRARAAALWRRSPAIPACASSWRPPRRAGAGRRPLAAAPPVAYRAELRLAEIEAAGRVQLIADDDLLLGPAGETPVLNDRTRIATSGAARVALASDFPVVGLIGNRPDGDLLRLLAQVGVSWSVSDVYGLAKVTQRWTLDGVPDRHHLHGGRADRRRSPRAPWRFRPAPRPARSPTRSRPKTSPAASRSRGSPTPWSPTRRRRQW